MRHIVSFRTLWAWIAAWVLMDLVFMSFGSILPEFLMPMASADNLSRHCGTAFFIFCVWCFVRETAE